AEHAVGGFVQVDLGIGLFRLQGAAEEVRTLQLRPKQHPIHPIILAPAGGAHRPHAVEQRRDVAAGFEHGRHADVAEAVVPAVLALVAGGYGIDRVAPGVVGVGPGLDVRRSLGVGDRHHKESEEADQSHWADAGLAYHHQLPAFTRSRRFNSSSDGFCVAKEPVLSAPAGSYVAISMPPAVVRCSTSFIEPAGVPSPSKRLPAPNVIGAIISTSRSSSPRSSN